MTRTRRSDPDAPGIRRVRRGRGFSYHDAEGELVRDEATLERVRELAIPPAWKDVWICPDGCGHIQAVGTDAAGRRQYLYHAAWRARRDREKFERLAGFAAAMPKVRRRLAEDLARPALDRERVLAAALRLLDIGMFRVGGDAYAEENESFGLATLRKDHVRVRRGAIEFDYIAKGGQPRSQRIEDELVLPTVLALKRRRGQPTDRLLAYRTRAGWHDVRAEEINDQLKALVGEEYSAKDFRTWNATVVAAMYLARRAGADDTTRAVGEALEEVAHLLGNTPAVCRDSYVDPRVIERFEQGKTIAPALRRLNGGRGSFADRTRIEAAVLRLLR